MDEWTSLSPNQICREGERVLQNNVTNKAYMAWLDVAFKSKRKKSTNFSINVRNLHFTLYFGHKSQKRRGKHKKLFVLINDAHSCK